MRGRGVLRVWDYKFRKVGSSFKYSLGSVCHICKYFYSQLTALYINKTCLTSLSK